MPQLEINVDSTSLGSSACILNWKRVVVDGYTEKAMGAALVYGIAVHKFIDVMFKTGGHYPTARREAEELFLKIPCHDDKKKPYLRELIHLKVVCNHVWSYVETEDNIDILAIPQDCYWCKGTGFSGLAIPCIKCGGAKQVTGPATEVTFKIPYYEDNILKVNLCGTIDTVGKIKNGCYIIRDWKTTGAWDNSGYFRQYELSRQLRLYIMACKLMTKMYPQSILGQIGATNMGARIDAIFLKPDSNATEVENSDVFMERTMELDRFDEMLKLSIMKLSEAIRTDKFPKEGIVNGSCSNAYGAKDIGGKCKFWPVCKSDDNIGQVLLARDYKKGFYDPLMFNQ